MTIEDPTEAVADRTLADFLLDVAADDSLPEDIRDEASEWQDKQTGTAPAPDDGPEEGQEPG